MNKLQLIPRYVTPFGKNEQEVLEQCCNEELKKKYKSKVSLAAMRLKSEINAIREHKIAGYFLVIQDIVNYAKIQSVPVGPGRGASAGSIVNYLLGITEIDPLRYGLIFERFFNPKVQEFPDISIDLCSKKRQEVVDYVIKKYGNKKTGNTTGTADVEILGWPLLSLLDKTLKLIKNKQNKDIDIAKIPLDDPSTLKLFAQAKTAGIFMFGGSETEIGKYLKKVKPDCFEDIVALLALYRPGPIGIGLLDTFIKNRYKKSSIKYLHPKLEPILKETYGLVVYQEQIMRIASSLAGFDLADADILRRSFMSKREDMSEQSTKFVQGCIKNRIKEPLAVKIRDLLKSVASYTFNKSHSVVYSLVSYRHAYLKANFPNEFMRELLLSERKNAEILKEYEEEAREMGLDIDMKKYERS